MIERIYPPGVPAPRGPYSPAVRAGDFIFVSGQVPVDPAQVYELMGFDGTRSTALAVHLDLIFLGLTFRGRFLLIDQPEGVLGRNILNHLKVVFNGPGLLWETVK